MLAAEDATWAAAHAVRLLRDVGADEVCARVPALGRHPAVGWAASGLAACTGEVGAAGLMAPAPIAAAADGAMMAMIALAPALAGIDGAALLGVRARLLGLTGGGATSANGACHLMRTRTGPLVVNLPRAEDWEMVPAWLEAEAPADVSALRTMLAGSDGRVLMERAVLLGMAVADVPITPPSASWVHIAARGPRAAAGARLKVVDLSSLWAGPLCGRLLLEAGCDVVKVESRTRPDGAREGNLAFFQQLNGGKASVVVDLASREDLMALRAVIGAADIVIDSSRPRAMRQLGLAPEECVARSPGLTWVSITGYGRERDVEDRVAFGDDAAMAAGLGGAMRAAHGRMMFCGDAIADPLTGLHAAVAALALRRGGGGVVASVPLRGVVSSVLVSDELVLQERRRRTRVWSRVARGCAVGEVGLSRREVHAAGQDTQRVLRALAPC